MSGNAYECSKCGLAVIVRPPAPPIRACACTAPIAMSMSASVEGKGGVAA